MDEFEKLGIGRNDALVEVDCGRQPKCCEHPNWIREMGAKFFCKCLNCERRCNYCNADYMKP